jgi:hypothetical protein
LRDPLLQGHVAEHSGLQLVVVSAHIRKTLKTSYRYPVSGFFRKLLGIL